MLSKGYQVGQYVLLNQVGSGGFGDVWKAEKRTALDTNYFALKFFRPKDDRIDFDTIGKELAVWKRLKGLPHIISVIELDSFQDYVYVVSDFADGGSLEKWLKDNNGKAPSQSEAVKITLEILTGLENLHEKGFVHRDLKPDNILIMNGKFCLTDFGVSREIKTHSKATGTAGTMEYMPPEAFAKIPSITSQTDIWAVGVILQRLLTGALPYPQEDYPSLVSAILMYEPEEMPESVPEGLREIIKKTLQKKREDRFRTAVEMIEALKNPARFLADQRHNDGKTEIFINSDFKDAQKIETPVTKDWREIEAELRQRREAEQAKLEETEIEREKAENKAEIERLTEAYRQHIVNHQQFSSPEIAELKRLTGQQKFNSITEKFVNERRKKDQPNEESERVKYESVKEQNEVPKTLKQQEKIFSRQKEKKGWFQNDRLIVIVIVGIIFTVGLFGTILLFNSAVNTPVSNNSSRLTNINANSTNMFANAASSSDSKSADYYFNIAFNCEKSNYDCQINNYTKAIELDPRNSASYNNRGLAYYQKKYYDLAIKDHTKAIDLNPKYTNAYIGRGNAYDNKGDYDEAIDNYKVALSIEPDNKIAKGNMDIVSARKNQSANSNVSSNN